LADSAERPAEVPMGVWLRRWRHKRQKSLRVVAGLSGVSPTYLCSLERGYRPMPTTGIRLTVRLADALGLPREELLLMLIREADRHDKEGR
jgi:transcriptional regulator with XRE-family HTH domain